MIKKRIVGTIVIKDNFVVRGINFSSYYPVGKIKYTVEALNRWGVDEIAIIDISATKSNIINYKMIKEVSNLSNIPILYSGGISSISQIKKILKNGADKVMINNLSHHNLQLLNDFSNYFGRQCIVLSVDLLKKNNKYYIFNYLDSKIHTSINFKNYFKDIIRLPIGEIFFNSVNNSGMMKGIDQNFLKYLPKECNLPIIVGGGIGNSEHVFKAFLNPKVNAVSIGNSLNFLEHSIVVIKSFLKKNNLNIRLDTNYNYINHPFSKKGYLKKLDKKLLDKLIFKIHKDEVI